MFDETYANRDKQAFCASCGHFPAYRPRVHVMNTVDGTRDQYLLDLPHHCDRCVGKLGLTRHNILVPKGEGESFTGACEDFMSRIGPWIAQLQGKQLKELIDSGMPEEDAKDMLGIAE